MPASDTDITGDLRVGPRLTIPASELSWRFSRSGGAGGQHVNTSDTRVELSWDVAASPTLGATQRSRALARLAGDHNFVDGVLTIAASSRRSQLRNRADARERLAALVAEALAPPPPPRRATKPSRGARQRRLDDKKRRGEIKRDRQRPSD